MVGRISTAIDGLYLLLRSDALGLGTLVLRYYLRVKGRKCNDVCVKNCYTNENATVSFTLQKTSFSNDTHYGKVENLTQGEFV